MVEGALRGGHTLKATWETLRDEHKLSMTYETFRSYCRRAGLGQAIGGDVVARAAPSALMPAASASATPAARPQQPDEARPRGFQHERVPRKKDQLDDVVLTGRILFADKAQGRADLISEHAGISAKWATHYSSHTRAKSNIRDVMSELNQQHKRKA